MIHPFFAYEWCSGFLSCLIRSLLWGYFSTISHSINSIVTTVWPGLFFNWHPRIIWRCKKISWSSSPWKNFWKWMRRRWEKLTDHHNSEFVQCSCMISCFDFLKTIFGPLLLEMLSGYSNVQLCLRVKKCECSPRSIYRLGFVFSRFFFEKLHFIQCFMSFATLELMRFFLKIHTLKNAY